MRVLVTGHAGYIGTVLVPMLLQAGHEVIGLDTNLFERSTFSDGIAEIPEIRKDVRDATLADVEGFDAILHLAGLSNDPLGDLNPDLTFEINHAASVNLARLAKQAGVQRFIFSSSCSNYGAGGDDLLDEHSAFNPVHALRHLKSEGGAGRCPPGGCALQPYLPAQCHGLWCFARVAL